MAQINLLADQHICRVGRESTFQTTAGTMIRLALSGRQRPLGASTREMLKSADLGLYRHDPNQKILGRQMGSPVPIVFEVKGIPTRLTSSATPAGPSSASALSHTVMYDHWLGGTHVDAGSTVAASPSPTAGGCTVAAGHGSRFVVGGIIGFNGVPRVVTAVSTDAITWYPDLSAAPSAGDVITNSFSHYRAEAQTQSLTVETAYYETGTPEDQRRARGVVGQCAWAAEMGQLGKVTFNGTAASTDGPGDLSISVTEVSDDMGASIRWDGVADMFVSGTTSAPTHACIRSIKPAVPNKWATVMCGSAENTVNSAVATGGREDPITVELELRFDAAMYTGFEAGTKYTLFAYTTQGSGSSQRTVGWYFPTLSFAEKPVENEQDGLIYITAKMEALQSSVTSGSDAARSPATLFLM